MHNGVVYMFTQNHTGAWNSNHVVSTNLSAQIELLPDKIIQYVGEKGYSRTFVQLTDPALDPDNMVVPGDYWVKSDTLASVWENPNSSNVKWNDFNNHTWGSMMTSMADMYCRRGTGANAEWVPVNDINYITEAYTRIEQTRDQITQEAYRANAAEGQLDTKINQTAHDIMLTAERSYIAQTDAYDSVNKIIDEAISLANDAATSAKNASIAKTAIYQSADAIVTAAVATAGDNADESYIAKTTTYQTADQIVTAAQKTTAANMAPAFSTSKAYAIGDVVSYQGDIYIFTSAHSKGAWNLDHVSKTNLDAASSGKYIAQTASYQTADAIVNEAVTTAEGQAATNIAPAFSTSKAYAVGDVVSYQGTVYVFTTAHPKGAWNASHVTATNMNSVATSNYIAKTSAYQTADAIVTTAETNSAKNVAPAFSTTKAYAIGDLVSYQGKVYVFTAAHSAGAWNASHVSATNMSDVSDGTYLAKTSTYQTADAIVSTAEIQAARNIAPAFSTSKNYAVGDLVSRSGLIYVFTTAHPKGTWNEEHVSATNMTTQADGSYIAKTSTYQTAASIVSAAQTYTNDKLTNYSTTVQTSTLIANYVTDNAYGKVSGIEITADGIEVSGSKYVKIKSGGTFTVDSGNFSISATGKVTIAPGGGTISTWTIGQQSFYNYVEDSSTHIRSHYVGLGTGTYAIWAGAAETEASKTPSAGNSPFWVKTTGEMKATLGTVGGWTIGTNYIGNAGTRGDSTVGMAIVSSDSSMAFWAGGAFTGGTPTFSVTKGGALTSTSGKIGGWNITANRIASGSGTGYVAMDSNTSNTYAIWAGNSTAGSAPFRVQRDGTVYLTKLKMVKETSSGTTTEDVNFSSNDNRLRGATVLGWTVSGSTLTISTTYGQINFNKATSLSGTWNGGGMLNITASGTSTSLASVAIGNTTPVWGTGTNKYKATIDITDNGSFVNYTTAVIRTITVDAEDIWKQGWNDAVDSGRQVTYYNLGDTSHASQELFYKSGSSYISIGTGWTKPTTVNLVLVPQKKT